MLSIGGCSSVRLRRNAPSMNDFCCEVASLRASSSVSAMITLAASITYGWSSCAEGWKRSR